MFQPQYIGISSFPEDLIRQLITIRHKNLNDKNPLFSKHFQDIQKQLNLHEKQFRKSPESSSNPQSEQILHKVLNQLQLQHYNLFSNQKSSTQSNPSLSSTFTPSKKSAPIHLTSQNQKVTPYHFTKFRSSLNKFSLSCTKENDKLIWNKVYNKEKQNRFQEEKRSQRKDGKKRDANLWKNNGKMKEREIQRQDRGQTADRFMPQLAQKQAQIHKQRQKSQYKGTQKYKQR